MVCIRFGEVDFFPFVLHPTTPDQFVDIVLFFPDFICEATSGYPRSRVSTFVCVCAPRSVYYFCD